MEASEDMEGIASGNAFVSEAVMGPVMPGEEREFTVSYHVEYPKEARIQGL